MTQDFQRRGLFTSRGFTLLEFLITFSLIGIITALLIPNILQARQESVRQAARQQAKVLETALANWFTAQSSLAAASTAWNTYANSNGYINTATFLTDTAGLAPYLPDNHDVVFTMQAGGSPIITTAQMQQLTAPSAGNFIGGNINGVNNTATVAHVVLYWVPAFSDPNTSTPTRNNTSPKVLFFLPDIP